MSTLTGTKIKDTYPGLIKLDDNGAVQPTALKTLTDGTGGTLPIQVSQVETKFTSGSLVDFTGTTVTGIAAAGLVAGTATDSLKNADSLVTNPATSSGPQSIALGNGAVANNNQAIAIGNFAESTSIGSAAVGEYASASGIYSSAWGRTSYARADGSVAFGQQAGVNFGSQYAGAVSMGRQVVAVNGDTTHVRALYVVAPDGGTGGNGITLLSPNGTEGEITLTDASELAVDGTPIGGGGAAGLVADTGTGSQKSADAISDGANSATGYRSIAIGSGNQANSSIGVAIGNYTRAGSNSVAIGDNANTTLGATASSVSIGQGANATINAVAIGNNAQSLNQESIAIGRNAITGTSAPYAVAIGKGSQSLDDWSVAVGGDAFGYSRYCTAIGGNAKAGLLGSGSGGENAVAIGNQPVANSQRAIAIGYDADALATDAIAIGSRADATAQGAIAIGSNTSSLVAPQATAVNAVALGVGVVASTVDTVTIKLLQIANYATMNYADDAAAATGGIPLGGVYHTSGALKIRIA